MFSILDMANSKKDIHSVLVDIDNVSRQEFEYVKDSISTTQIENIYQNDINFTEENGMIVKLSDGINEYEIGDTTGLATKEELNNKVNIDNTVVDINFIEQEVIGDGLIAITKIESVQDDKIYVLGTDTNHVLTTTGYTKEESYIELLKSTSKDFSTTTGSLLVENVIEKQRILGGIIKGQTIKNHISNIERGDYILDAGNIKIPCLPLQIGKEYTLILKLKEYTVGTSPSILALRGVREQTQSTGWVQFSPTELKVGVIKKTFVVSYVDTAYYNNTTSIYLQISAMNAGQMVKVSSVALVEGKVDTVLDMSNPIELGFNSLKSIINMNSIAYPIYDTNNNIIKLDRVENIADTLEFKSDNIVTYTQNIIEYKISDLFPGKTSFGASWKCDLEGVIQCYSYYDGTNGSTNMKVKGPLICDNIPYNPSIFNTNNVGITSNSQYLAISMNASDLDGVTAENYKTVMFNKVKDYTVKLILKTPIVIHIPKEYVPTLITIPDLTELQFSVGEDVKGQEFSMTVPVNIIEDTQTQINDMNDVAIQLMSALL